MPLNTRRAWGLLSLGLLAAIPALAGDLTPALARHLSTLPPDASVRVLVALADQADIPALDRRLHEEKAPLARRHREVVEALRRTARDSQGPLLDALEVLRDEGKVAGWTSHWIVNAVVVGTTAAAAPLLADLPGVAEVEVDLVPELIAPVATGEAARDGADREIGITPGVVAIQADRVWYELGIRGEGAIVANMDTGVNRNHESLNARWRGNLAPASECWLDVYDNTTLPSDQHGHGTHVMGTITGVASNDSIGVCPAALWIASNVILGGVGAEFDNAVIQALEWYADPDGDPNTLDDVPDVVQNSWGINESFGYPDCDSRWWAAIDNCEAAGVCITWSAGNEGPGSTSLRSPADRATSATNVFSVGSVAYTPPYTVSSWSSRGPSGCGGAFAIKPEVVAPGANIYSADAWNTTGYVYMDGTSMAGPHVAGVVGLMRSANPDLDVTTIKTILMETATNLGPAGDDNSYGWGLINAYEAVLQSMTGYGTLRGTVTGLGGLPLAGALVADGAGHQDLTDAAGRYAMLLPAGEHAFTASAYGHAPAILSATVAAGDTTTLDFDLAPLPHAVVSGLVRDGAGAPLAGAQVSVTGPGMPPVPPVVTGGDGAFAFELLVGQEVSVAGQGAPDPLRAPLGPDAGGYRAFDPGDGDWCEARFTVAAGGNTVELQGRNRVAYAWTTIDPDEGGPGTALVYGVDDDDLTHLVDLPFTFRYHGQDHTQVSINANGWVALGATTSTDYSNSAIPAADGPPAMLAAFWDDLSPQLAESGNVSHWHSAATGRFIVEFHHIRQYNPATAFESFQVILLDPDRHPTETGDGAIIFQYEEVSDLNSNTVGIENPAETSGLQYYYITGGNATYGAGCPPLAPGLAVLYTTGLQVTDTLWPVSDLHIAMLPGQQPHLTWTAVPGAAFYRVERAARPDHWQAVGTTTGTSWTDVYATGLRLYRVVAVN